MAGRLGMWPLSLILLDSITNYIPKPDADTFFEFGGPQPFVPLYAVILGEGGHIFMNVICVVTLWFVCISPPPCLVHDLRS